jgi:hypothetical protein
MRNVFGLIIMLCLFGCNSVGVESEPQERNIIITIASTLGTPLQLAQRGESLPCVMMNTEKTILCYEGEMLGMSRGGPEGTPLDTVVFIALNNKKYKAYRIGGVLFVK